MIYITNICLYRGAEGFADGSEVDFGLTDNFVLAGVCLPWLANVCAAKEYGAFKVFNPSLVYRPRSGFGASIFTTD